MRRQIAIILFGFGVDTIFFTLSFLVEIIPDWVGYVALVIGTSFMFGGAIAYFSPTAAQRTLELPEIIIRINCHQGNNPDSWLTFRVDNRSNVEIVDCMADLVHVAANNNERWTLYPASLYWSSQDGNGVSQNIEAGDQKTVDVARTHRDDNLVEFLLHDAENPLWPTGEYTATIRFQGRHYNRRFEGRFTTTFTYHGINRFSCESDPGGFVLEANYV